MATKNNICFISIIHSLEVFTEVTLAGLSKLPLIINKTKALLPQALVTLVDFGSHVVI
jgi:hypothetical protein